MLKTLQNYFYTIQHLKFIQIYKRILFSFYKPSPVYKNFPSVRENKDLWAVSVRKDNLLLNKSIFNFCNETGDLKEIGWNGDEKSDLWRFNQHYFDYLLSSDNRKNKTNLDEIIASWISSNLPCEGIGWSSYPVSLRIVNWIKWVLEGNDLSIDAIESLVIQTRHLSRRVEYDLLGNHLIKNAKALIFAGYFFEGIEADSWLKQGFGIIKGELKEQILEDGGNYERSPMYHSIVLEDLLDLVNLSNIAKELFESDIRKLIIHKTQLMFNWLEGMIHPDGEISFFNDAAFGIATKEEGLRKYANDLGLEIKRNEKMKGDINFKHFEESGYIRVNSKDYAAIVDVAKLGPDYQPGHAHADTLSFELSLFGQRVIVNGGTSCYGQSPKRLNERKTVSHSTVEVDSKDSSEVWGGFRVARRANPLNLVVEKTIPNLSISCSHDGYTRLRGKPLHTRSWNFDKKKLHVYDEIKGGKYSAIAKYIFHPDIIIKYSNDKTIKAYIKKDIEVSVEVLMGTLNLGKASFSPEFGKVHMTSCLDVIAENGKAEIAISWD